MFPPGAILKVLALMLNPATLPVLCVIFAPAPTVKSVVTVSDDTVIVPPAIDMLDAVISQDMYLAGGFVLILCSLTIIGTLISDILLAWADPRIRLE